MALIKNKWTLKKLLQNTYLQRFSRNRFDYKERDVIKKIIIKKVNRYESSWGTMRSTFIIESSSYPQYYPYIGSGSNRRRQRRYRHDYDVIISLDRLSLNVPFTARVGSDRKWDFSKNGRSVKDKKTGRITEGTNIKKGINGDFFFRCSFLWKQEGILFGRNYSNGFPRQVNPKGVIFAPKHLINVIEQLMNRGILKDD